MQLRLKYLIPAVDFSGSAPNGLVSGTFYFSQNCLTFSAEVWYSNYGFVPCGLIRYVKNTTTLRVECRQGCNTLRPLQVFAAVPRLANAGDFLFFAELLDFLRGNVV